MSDPWLTIVGLGEDGPAGLSQASRESIARAEAIFGGPRHLELIGAGARGHAWPVPFSTAPVLARRGQRVVVLASGDPFWFGAGGSLVRDLRPGEWVCHPAPSTFSWAAARLGWRLEETLCLGLHAAPLSRLRPILADGQRLVCLLRDGAAAVELAAWLAAAGYGDSRLWVLEALGGPRERIRQARAARFGIADIQAPVAMAIEAEGAPGLPHSSGLPEQLFAHDGQITKRHVRALTVSALAPRPGECLWDLGAGSGSVSVEWCLAAPQAVAHPVECRKDRVTNISANADAFGLAHRISVHQGSWPDCLDDLPRPDAVFVGGGLDETAFDRLWAAMPGRARLVVNTVTLETESLIVALHARLGGSLVRICIEEAAPLGRLRGWVPARPVVQWSVIK